MTIFALFIATTVHATEKNAQRTATFAGGCFWCVEAAFESLDGVVSVTSGYTGGQTPSPTYKQVSAGKTNHVEAVQIVYDSARVSYRQLLEVYWRQIDPTDDGGQFADRGKQYRAIIFYHSTSQKKWAWTTRKAIAQSGHFKSPIVVPIRKATTFYPAEAYHQDFFRTNPERYNSYKKASGRADYIKRVWGAFHESMTFVPYQKPDTEKLRKRLTPVQFEVTQNNGTEPPFQNTYWNNKEEGIYIDVVSGEPLFSSTDKFDSGTGWPSFTRPVEPANVIEKSDTTHGMRRTEVRSRWGNAHLGHLFSDGPAPTHNRYCINSASLRFVPKKQLAAHGLAKYMSLFESAHSDIGSK